MSTTARIPVHREPTLRNRKGSLLTFARVGRPHITVIAALGVFTFGWLFLGKYQWLLTAVCALDWYIVNLINRIVDLAEDRVNEIEGTVFIHKNRRTLLGLGVGLLLVSLVAVHLLNPAITALRIAGHLLGIFYNWPLLPGGCRLKQLYFLKNTASGMGFLFTVFGYPLATAAWKNGAHTFPAGISWTAVVFSAVFFYLFIQSYEIIYDLRDVAGDTLAGIRTYPVVHGERVAVYIVDGLLFSSTAVLAVGYIAGVVPWRIFIMIAAPILQFFVYKSALRRGITTQDCIRITWMGATLLFIYHLWIAADLPGATS